MGIVASLICVFLCVLGYKIDKKLFSPLGMFTLIWSAVLFLSHFNFFGFYGANSYVYIIIIIGVFSYFLGCYFIMRKRGDFKIGYRGIYLLKSTCNNQEVKNILLWIILIFAFAYSFMKFQRALPYIMMNNGMGYVRLQYWKVGGAITTSAFDYFIDAFLVKGCRLAAEVILINEFTRRRKVNIVQLLILIAIIGLEVLCSGGRMVLFDLCLYFVFAIRLNKYSVQRKISFKQKVLIVIVIIAAVYAMFYLTADRQSNSSFLKSLYANFVGGISLMNTLVNDVLGDRLTWGTLFFRGIISVFYTFLNTLLDIPFPEAFNVYAELISPFYSVGSNITMNAYTTCFLFFYADFRLVGVFVFSWFFGFGSSLIYRRVNIYQSSTYVCTYMIILNVIVYSVIRWQFSNSAYIFAIFLVWFLYRNSDEDMVLEQDKK